MCIFKSSVSKILFVFALTFAFCQASSILPLELSDTDQALAGNKMLILTTSKYEKALDGYINWKVKRGLDVELDVLSAEKGAEAIQQKLQEKYDSEGLTFIVLVGDIDDVPSVMLAGYPT